MGLHAPTNLHVNGGGMVEKLTTEFLTIIKFTQNSSYLHLFNKIKVR